MAKAASNAFSVSVAARNGGGWSFKGHAAGAPYNVGGCKHTALLYEPDTRRIIQCGGDFQGSNEIAPNGVVWDVGSTRRDMYAADPTQATLTWTKVQPIFMPEGQDQGPMLGPDQVWFWRRTAGGRNEIYVGPGFYRPHADPANYGSGAGTPYRAFKWLHPGWQMVGTRAKVPNNAFTDPVTQFPRWFGDSGEPDKFCAYDEVTDSAYCINDFFEVIKFDHVANDWDHCPSGNAYTNLFFNRTDDRGRPLAGAADITCGGSQQAIVGRRVYALCKWRNGANTDVRSSLVWYDIDAVQVGAISCPFDVDPAWPVPGGRNPDESSMLCALNGRLVVGCMTYFGIDVGGRPIWTYDPATQTWANGEPVPEWIGGNAIVAVPDQNAVYLMGSTANPAAAGGGWDKAAVYRMG
jgi:hypothetical protein